MEHTLSNRGSGGAEDVYEGLDSERGFCVFMLLLLEIRDTRQKVIQRILLDAMQGRRSF